MSTVIIYSTKHGGTEKCAHLLAEKLAGKVDLHNLKDQQDLNLAQYDQVIIGGPIYMGKVKKEITNFCDQNISLLKTKTLGLFICCLQTGQTAEDELHGAFPTELFDQAVAKEFLGGELRLKEMNFLERFIIKMVTRADARIPSIKNQKEISLLSMEKFDRLAQTLNNA